MTFALRQLGAEPPSFGQGAEAGVGVQVAGALEGDGPALGFHL
jgi:hypothetical protein